MRHAWIALAASTLACSSSTEVKDTRQPGPSMQGSWIASDTLQRVLVLNLGQYDTGALQGFGYAAADRVTATGLNVVWPPCPSKRGCQARFPIAITVTDTSGARLHLEGAFARRDTNTFVVEEIDESPGFPFAVAMRPATLTFARTLITSESNRR